MDLPKRRWRLVSSLGMLRVLAEQVGLVLANGQSRPHKTLRQQHFLLAQKSLTLIRINTIEPCTCELVSTYHFDFDVPGKIVLLCCGALGLTTPRTFMAAGGVNIGDRPRKCA